VPPTSQPHAAGPTTRTGPRPGSSRPPPSSSHGRRPKLQRPSSSGPTHGRYNAGAHPDGSASTASLAVNYAFGAGVAMGTTSDRGGGGHTAAGSATVHHTTLRTTGATRGRFSDDLSAAAGATHDPRSRPSSGARHRRAFADAPPQGANPASVPLDSHPALSGGVDQAPTSPYASVRGREGGRGHDSGRGRAGRGRGRGRGRGGGGGGGSGGGGSGRGRGGGRVPPGRGSATSWSTGGGQSPQRRGRGNGAPRPTRTERSPAYRRPATAGQVAGGTRRGAGSGVRSPAFGGYVVCVCV